MQAMMETATRRKQPRPVRQTAGSPMEQLVGLLRGRCGTDFAAYNNAALERRIHRRMGLYRLDTLPAYLGYLRQNPDELDLLAKELLIGVTHFFRDAEVWSELTEQALPALLAATPAHTVLRAWVPACSTGEEAYTLAICFAETRERLAPDSGITLQILATDIDTDALVKARRAIYPASIATEVAPARLASFFKAHDQGFQIRPAIRDMVFFAPQNLLTDLPFNQLDIASCRNLLIYLTPAAQQRALSTLHYALKPGGLLLLGPTENHDGGEGEQLFAIPPGARHIYRRTAAPPPATTLAWPQHERRRAERVVTPDQGRTAADSLRTQVERFLLAHYTPAAVLVNALGDVLHISGDTTPYLDPPAGKTNWNVFAIARDGLRQPLIEAVRQAAQARQARNLGCLRVTGDDATYDIEVMVDASCPCQGDDPRILIVLSPAKPRHRKKAKPCP